MNNIANKKAVILLSGGLDSFVSLACAIDEGFCVKQALTFDYGQRAAMDEINAASEIARFYNIPFEVIKLPFLEKISTSALNNVNVNIEFETPGQKSADIVWVPNRNGLFMNIAATYCDSMNYDHIIFGANKEEAQTFSDNSKAFIDAVENEFLYSTRRNIKIYAPLFNLEKHEIVNKGIKLGIDFKLLKSCYNSSNTGKNGEKSSHCGRCESCIRLKNAILKSDNKDLIKLFF